MGKGIFNDIGCPDVTKIYENCCSIRDKIKILEIYKDKNFKKEKNKLKADVLRLLQSGYLENMEVFYKYGIAQQGLADSSWKNLKYKLQTLDFKFFKDAGRFEEFVEKMSSDEKNIKKFNTIVKPQEQLITDTLKPDEDVSPRIIKVKEALLTNEYIKKFNGKALGEVLIELSGCFKVSDKILENFIKILKNKIKTFSDLVLQPGQDMVKEFSKSFQQTLQKSKNAYDQIKKYNAEILDFISKIENFFKQTTRVTKRRSLTTINKKIK